MMSLKDAFASILGPQPEHTAVRRIIEEGHHLALAYLKTKVRRGSLQVRHFGLSLDDLALDCLADLFQRDEHGRFVQLVTYFESIAWHEKDEAGVRIAWRRLVFSQINEGLFRRHRGHDPELARIIRNLKNAVKASESLTLVRHGKELWMVMVDEGSLRERPPFPFELLEAHLAAHLHPGIQMPEVVAAFQMLLEAMPDYACGYPVSRLALAVRSAHMRQATASSLVPEDPLPFDDADVQEAIQHVTEDAYKSMYNTYVASGKVDERMFETYVQATRDILSAQFSGSVRPLDSYYDALIMNNHHDIPKEDYRRKHRHVLEYLVKTSRARLVDHLRQRMQSA